jgi:hypothetical protein
MARYAVDWDDFKKFSDLRIIDSDTATTFIPDLASHSKMLAITRYDQWKIEQEYHVSVKTINVESIVKERVNDLQRSAPEYWMREIENSILDTCKNDTDAVDAILIPDLDYWVDLFDFYPSYMMINRWKDYSGTYSKNIVTIFDNRCNLDSQRCNLIQNSAKSIPKIRIPSFWQRMAKYLSGKSSEHEAW